MKRVLSLTVSVAIAAATVSLVAASPAAATAPAASTVTATPAAYESLDTPARALDTRATGGGGALAPGQTRALPLPQVTATSTAVVLNLTVADPTAAGYLTVFPAGSTRPLASSINFRAGEIRSNSVTVALPTPATGVVPAIDIYNFAGNTDVVVDVLGDYDPATNGVDGGSTYLTQTPTRVADTRQAGAPLKPGGALPVKIASPDINSVTDVAVNITAVNPTGQGFLTAYDGIGTKPATSTVNYGTDPVTPNFAVVGVNQADDGSLSFVVDNSGSQTDVVVDVLGYYATDAFGGGQYTAVAPDRIYDSRDKAAPLGSNASRDIPTPAATTVLAVNLNVTAVDATVPTFLTVYPQGTTRPTASNLNPFTPFALANAVQTGVTYPSETATSPEFSVYNLAGSVDVVADLQGYFVAV